MESVSKEASDKKKKMKDEIKMKQAILEVKDLQVTVQGNQILHGINLTIHAGEVHAIMGPNGSGKSTLAQVLAGHPSYVVEKGTVLYEGRDLLSLSPEDRAKEGIFLAFQYPVEIPGLSNVIFLRTAFNEVRKHRGQEELDPLEFDVYLRQKIKVVEMEMDLVSRRVNEGFSGGEKKKNEILQMAVLEPKLAILDETDSGLDIDALQSVAEAVNRQKTGKNAFLLVTHYQRLLDYIIPDFVHVLLDGRIVKSGGKELALELESKGYDWIKEATPAGA